MAEVRFPREETKPTLVEVMKIFIEETKHRRLRERKHYYAFVIDDEGYIIDWVDHPNEYEVRAWTREFLRIYDRAATKERLTKEGFKPPFKIVKMVIEAQEEFR
jgi:hypothetical protein